MYFGIDKILLNENESLMKQGVIIMWSYEIIRNALSGMYGHII